MAHNTIAIVADCDDTLAPDTTAQLLERCGIDPRKFFRATAAMINEGWDHVLAYLNKLIELAQSGESLTRDRFEEIGRELEFYPGVPECFATLKQEIESDPKYGDVGVRVECYVISSGIGDMLRASPLADVMHTIWACDFAYDESGVISFPKRVISFTDKTRYLFLIQKGIVGQEFANSPYVVNEPMTDAERPIPFRNMIHLGDSPGDIPCMSLLQYMGPGYVIGILSKENPDKTWTLGYGRRANITVPPEYAPGGFAFEQLRVALLDRADDIRRRLTGTGLSQRN